MTLEKIADLCVFVVRQKRDAGVGQGGWMVTEIRRSIDGMECSPSTVPTISDASNQSSCLPH